MQADMYPVWHLLSKALIGLVVTSLGAFMLYPIRKAKQEWTELKNSLEETKAELIQQRTNCLQTLQSQGERQIELLEKVSDTLDNIHLDQKETLGFIRGSK